MKVFIIGATGLLGSEAARQLVDAGHEVSGLALPPIPTGAPIPEEMILKFGNYAECSDAEMAEYLKDMDGVVFAAGVDERVECPSPVYDFFKKWNIDALQRILKIAKEQKVKHAVVLGSYFVHMNRKFPEFNLYEVHPYIRSRVDQEELAISMADASFDVAVLELPYIFGTQPGRKPVWTLLVDSVRATPDVTYYPTGGTTMVTVKQVGQSIVGALTLNKGGNFYPIGYTNMTWNDLMGEVHNAMGLKSRPIYNITKEQYVASVEPIQNELESKGLDSGLNMVKFADLQFSNMFIDKNEGSTQLGVTEDDIIEAIHDSIRLSIDVVDANVEVIDMKVD